MSVYQRNGHWYFDVTIDKKRKRKAIRQARNKEEAKIYEADYRNKVYSGYDEEQEKLEQERIEQEKKLVLFSDFIENKYKPYAKKQKKGYWVEISVLKSLVQHFSGFTLDKITTGDIIEFKGIRATEKTRLGKVRSKATVNKEIAILSAVLKLAVAYKLIKENPVTSGIYYSNRDLPFRERILSEDEEIVLFEKVSSDITLSQQIEVLLYTGIRRGELFNLEWRDIDFDESFINLRQETTKTNKARAVYMFFNVRQIFEQLLNESGEVRGTDKVFQGVKALAAKLSRQFRAVCTDLGWKDLNIHSLRHTYSTRCEKYNVSAFAHKALLGHTKLSMTERYTHLSKDAIKENLSIFEENISVRRKNAANESEKPLKVLKFNKNN